ncbi:unnamed protein product [Clonostachys rhizophaga]|uniref:Uncharacterized protein n=1 Tax=Clonostachys rhizophaga TaxID=160324 RepID=A0A9N9YPG2_9HYPO|nr:unnamed protein product [Clonostachys rhizophaga]
MISIAPRAIGVAVLMMAHNAMTATPQAENVAVQARDIWDGSDPYSAGYDKRSFSQRSLEDDEVAARARDVLQARSDLAQVNKRFIMHAIKGILKGAVKATKSDGPCYGKGPKCYKKEKALQEKKAREKKNPKPKPKPKEKKKPKGKSKGKKGKKGETE